MKAEKNLERKLNGEVISVGNKGTRLCEPVEALIQVVPSVSYKLIGPCLSFLRKTPRRRKLQGEAKGAKGGAKGAKGAKGALFFIFFT